MQKLRNLFQKSKHIIIICDYCMIFLYYYSLVVISSLTTTNQANNEQFFVHSIIIVLLLFINPLNFSNKCSGGLDGTTPPSVGGKRVSRHMRSATFAMLLCAVSTAKALLWVGLPFAGESGCFDECCTTCTAAPR